MMTISGFTVTAAVVGICLSLVSILANREKIGNLGEKTTFRMQRTLSFTLIAVAVGSSLFGLFWLYHEPQYQGQALDAMVPVAIGLCAVMCALVFSLYEVRIEETHLSYGLMGKKTIEYVSIKEIRDIRYEGSPRIILVTSSGRNIGIWSNLLGYDELVAEIKRRCNCTYTVMNTRTQYVERK
jgi:hypothetical protein